MDLEGTEIEIAISNAGTGTTRSARPVGSSEAHNNVDHVQLVFFQNNEVVKGVEYVAKTVTGSYSVDQNGLIKFDKIGDPNTPGNEPHENQKATLQVKGLDAGSYTIVAYGWNGESFPYGTISGPETGKMYYKADNTTSQKTGFNVEEVFAGTTEAIAKANTTETEDEIKTIVKFENSVKVVLTRQVAGMLAYFENVPKMIGETQVRKVTVDLIGQSTGFYFPASLWGKEAEQSEEFNGIGTTTTSTTELLTFSIAEDQATKEVDENGEEVEEEGTGTEIYDFDKSETGGKNYQLADGMSPNEKLVCKANTLFGGLYILPFSTHIGSGQQNATLVVNLRDANGISLKSMLVRTNKVPQTPDDAQNLAYYYDIRCNNFYSIGHKSATDSTTGDGGGDGDKPQSLISNNELVVLIADNWKVIHDMELD